MLGRSAAGAVRLSAGGGAEQPGHGNGGHGSGSVQSDAEERHHGGGRHGRHRPCRTDAGARRRGDERHEGARHGRNLRDLRPRGRHARRGHRAKPCRADQSPRAWRHRDVRGEGFRPTAGRQRGQALAARRIRPPGEPVGQPELQEARACRGMGSGAGEGRAVVTGCDGDPGGGGGCRGPRRIRRRDLLRHPRESEHPRRVDDGKGGRIHRGHKGDR